MCTTIRKQNNSEQFKQKLQIIKAKIQEVNKEVITLPKKIKTS